MGFYLNPDNKGFWKAVRSKIYVDKTELIACTNELINTEQQYLCVSRPRRFGKFLNMQQFLIDRQSYLLMEFIFSESSM